MTKYLDFVVRVFPGGNVNGTKNGRVEGVLDLQDVSLVFQMRIRINVTAAFKFHLHALGNFLLDTAVGFGSVRFFKCDTFLRIRRFPFSDGFGPDARDDPFLRNFIQNVFRHGLEINARLNLYPTIVKVIFCEDIFSSNDLM